MLKYLVLLVGVCFLSKSIAYDGWCPIEGDYNAETKQINIGPMWHPITFINLDKNTHFRFQGGVASEPMQPHLGHHRAICFYNLDDGKNTLLKLISNEDYDYHAKIGEGQKWCISDPGKKSCCADLPSPFECTFDVSY